MKTASRISRLYIGLIVLCGTGLFAWGVWRWECSDVIRFCCYLLIAIVASTLKIKLPGITGTMSVNFLFILIGIVQLTLPETLVMGCTATLLQSFWNPRQRPKLVHCWFNFASMAVAISISDAVYHSDFLSLPGVNQPLLLALAACTFFFANTFPVAIVISLTEGRPLHKLWQECYFWSFPYYLAGASIAWMLDTLKGQVGWQASLLLLPFIYFVYRSYRLYLRRLEDEQKHSNEIADLHLRTIEALALAIEAKDHTTHGHLRRVQVYALEVGKELGLSEDELNALRAASLLHDIGKLAVPEHIISKPGKLTPEEFEKMKIHPVVGAEILERVKFPYPVAPIVRAHHEKWNGSGYPAALKGEEIPIGARILTAVDCLDALASDRQYRRAMPLRQAMEHVVRDAGVAFDPQVVEILQRRFMELERLADAQPVLLAKLSKDFRTTNGAAPAAGFAYDSKPSDSNANKSDFMTTIAAARQEAQMLFELTQDLGNSLSLDETLSVLAVRLKRMIPYDSIAVYVREEHKLVPAYVAGQDFRLFSSLEIPVGEGVSGWVAANHKPIMNGNPSVEPGYLRDPARFSTLRSALAVPLEGVNGLLGVLTLYHAERDFFTADHRRMLLAVSSKLALSMENALKYRQAESSATTDYLTNLPNARSLFLRLDSELARAKRMGIPLSVLVCDLDGFKQFNDRFGHLEGNRLLRTVAEGLSASCREYDYAARIGGDEFVIVLPDIAPQALHARIEEFRQVVVEAARQVSGETSLSMSVGEAFYPDDGADAEQLLAEADRRMYKGKQEHKMLLQEPAHFSGLKPQTMVLQ